MAENHEAGAVSQDPRKENHVYSDRQSQHDFLEGRRIDHTIGEGTETSGRLRRLIDRFYEFRAKNRTTSGKK